MKRMHLSLLLLILIAAASLLCMPKAHAEPVAKLYAGTHCAWVNGGDPEMEVGGNGSVSLSPHISAVASAYHGVEHSYWVPRAGVRVTATDVDNRKFSVGIGLEYQLQASKAGPKEWCSVASVGYRPWEGKRLDPLLLVAQGSYGNSSQTARTLVGARWSFSF